ncbi:RidA family protein [Mesorhizobium sp. LNHC209A00]|uniref:Rid family hydrolase n=1 Tax=Mesorhizobium TaxID=68287 RepID=UPI0003CFF315|nr:RidA family protein [Mesorhizobium sp. LNHC209A00]ESY99784.1 translation initiation inhibitor protein [Mesorhizobium sp. LNHC209A00]
MKKEVIEVPVMSDKVRSLGLPCSTAVRANGFVFISATPPVDMVTGEMVRGDIETQTDASLKALKHCLEAAGTSLENVVMVRIYAVNSGFYNAINRVYARYFSVNPPARSFVPVAWTRTPIAISGMYSSPLRRHRADTARRYACLQ